MGKHILLIGVSVGELAEAYAEQSPAIANIAALKHALLTEVDALREDQVTTLINPNLRQMRHAIALTTYRCRHHELCLIYYTGCGVIDARTGTFYLPANDTRLDAITTTAISSDYIRQALPSIQQGLSRVMVLDCMWGALPQLDRAPIAADMTMEAEPKNRLAVAQLADCNCALFTALGSHTQPWPMTDVELSLYTQCLIEGLTTGLADIDADGEISVNDLQAYMAQALAATDRDIFPIARFGQHTDNSEADLLLRVPPYSPAREYRRTVENYAHRHRGQILPHERNVLDFLRFQLGITPHESQVIEAEVLAPYADHQQNCDRYRHALTAALELETPLGTSLKKWLRHLQSELSLSYEDVSAIETQLINPTHDHLQALPQWLPPVDQPQLPASALNPNGSIDGSHYR
ncbi:caspase domain protein [Leptolyngbya sp. Heron Island J]|uniref:hypothetical protein n=1 Tax=Leptolyngbya sp. Heron Island J TaxID=1385935 RepID=UPI0003B9C3D4|nr:hypothetical protein [Leptolyngbya sp. Heron Island J]ESA32599.1 caspase domain protein [Leptolyngbya sp. Heron Island J]